MQLKASGSDSKKAKTKWQPSELRSAFGNADHVADQLLL